jgi:hypothetical protein
VPGDFKRIATTLYCAAFTGRSPWGKTGIMKAMRTRRDPRHQYRNLGPMGSAKLAREFRLAQMRRGYFIDWALPTNWRSSACDRAHIIKGAGMTVAHY